MALRYGRVSIMHAKQQNADILVILDFVAMGGLRDPSKIHDFIFEALTANGVDIVIGSVVR